MTLITTYPDQEQIAKETDMELIMQAQSDFEAWYDAKYEETQSLIDEIAERTCYIIDEDEYDAFIELLAAEGITEASLFEDAFSNEFEGVNQEATFCEELIDELGYRDNLPGFIGNHLDYKMIWECELRHDFFVIEFRGNSYFFHNI